MGQVLLLLKLIHHSMTNEGQREKNIWLYITPNKNSDMIGKMTLEGLFLKKGYNREDNSGVILRCVGYSWQQRKMSPFK
jgi:hypothetical protein